MIEFVKKKETQEINMGFQVRGNLGSDALKKKLPIRVIDSKLNGLREIVQQMKTI